MKKTNRTLLIISLCLCLVSVIFAGAVQTDFGRVDMVEISLGTEAGTLTGYMFRPKAATAKSPAPAIVCSHGYLNNREMQDANYVELARRGYVVIAMNAYGHGDSEVAKGEETVQVQSGGMIEFVDYLAALPYVDKTNIGVTGHSMGGGYTITTMTYYTELEEAEYAKLTAQGTPDAEARKLAHEKNLINTGVPVGNYPSAMAQDRNGRSFLCNCSVILARWDEFFAANAVGMLGSDNTRALIKNLTGQDVAAAEDGKTYTGPSGYSITFYNPAQYHATNHFSVKECRYLVESFERTMPAPVKIPSANQTWWLKEAFNCLGLIGFFMFIVPFTDLMLSTEFFKELRKDGKLLDGPENERKVIGRGVWQQVICFLLIFPLLMAGYLLLINPVWPQDTTGGIGVWSVGCGLVALAFVKGSLKKEGKKLKECREELGLRTDRRTFLKTLLLALTVVAATYALVFLADGINQTDFRIWSFDIRVFGLSKAWVAVRYLPFFAVFYVFSALSASRMSFRSWSERKQMLVCALLNIIAPALMLIITYVPTVFFDATLWVHLFNGSGGIGGLLLSACALIPILMIPFVPILAISACINVRLYRLSDSIWLPGLINTLLITMITVANTSFSYAY
ncbi:MAG: alpha/beta fold hydrolase [Oscillospiraceae bacterium]|nr:alpha/beta fold hydrolase [Oscillospiraceae bacterium]